MPTFSIRNQDSAPAWQSVTISDNHFGANLLITNVPRESTSFTSSWLPDGIEEIGPATLRYPGGSVTEFYFSMANPNNNTWISGRLPMAPAINDYEVGHGNLIGQDEFLAQCSTMGAAAILVIPTRMAFTQSAAEALVSGTFGSRTIIDQDYLVQVTAYVKATMLSAYAQSTHVQINSFEIGNEFWGSGQMTAAEYGRVAAAVLQAAEDGINQAIAQQPGLGAMERPDLIVQSIHAVGTFSPNAAVTLYVSNGWVYDQAPDGLPYTTHTIAAQGNAATQLQQIANELINVVGLIDGIVDHHYPNRGFDVVDSQDYTFTQMGSFEQRLGLQIGTLDRYITEWNTQQGELNSRGLQGAGMLIETFYEITTHYVRNANVWPLMQYNNATNLLNGTSESVTVIGGMFQLMRESLIGTNPVLDFNMSLGGVTIDGHGFKSSVGSVIFVQNRGGDTADGVTLDMNNSGYIFDTRLNTSSYFITSTLLTAIDASGNSNTGNTGTIVSPVLTYSNGITVTGDLLDLESMTAWSNIRVEITYVTENGDFIQGRGGNDNINSSGGNDTILGDAGSDTLQGGNGNDFLYGGADNDSLNGGSGADALFGGSGSDLAIYWDATSGIRVDFINPALNTGISAGDTYDSIEHFTGGNFDDTLAGDNGNNSILAYAGNDSILGRDGNDTLNGGDGNDTLLGGAGADFLAGGNEIDLAAYWDTTTGLRVDLLYATTNTGIATGDTYSSIENFTGGNLGDTLFGDNADNTILGYAGDDVIAGRDGNDILQGGTGLDLLIGGAGRDYLYGGAGDGVRDTFRFDAISESAVGVNRDVIYDFVSGIDKIDLRTIDANTALSADQAFVFTGTAAADNAIWYAASGSNVIIRGDVDGDSVADFEIMVAGISSLISADFLL